jgi:hypothetical protein
MFRELLSSYSEFTAVYVDGSYLGRAIGFAVVYLGHISSYRRQSFHSVYTAELYALQRVRRFIRRQSRQWHLLCTDSVSALHRLVQIHQTISL